MSVSIGSSRGTSAMSPRQQEIEPDERHRTTYYIIPPLVEVTSVYEREENICRGKTNRQPLATRRGEPRFPLYTLTTVTTSTHDVGVLLKA
ncbi:uncharacterized [Tachysurus ichikawai]